jgi:hypothetical protein
MRISFGIIRRRTRRMVFWIVERALLPLLRERQAPSTDETYEAGVDHLDRHTRVRSANPTDEAPVSREKAASRPPRTHAD